MWLNDKLLELVSVKYISAFNHVVLSLLLSLSLFNTHSPPHSPLIFSLNGVTLSCCASSF